jgi:hypothetical protein
VNRAAVAMVAGAELRRGWRTLVLVGVLAGLVGSVAVGALALARRTSTAYERLAAATALDDARGLVIADEAVDEIVRLPGVTSSWTGRIGVAQLGERLAYVALIAGPDEPSPLYRPVVVDGRMPDPGAADELVLDEEFARVSELATGDRLDLRFLTGEDLRRFDTGFEGGRPNGPELELEVVGVVRNGGRSRGVAPAYAGPGFLRAHPDALEPGAQFFVRLEDGADGYPAFALRAEAVAARYAEDDGGAGAEFRPVDLTDPDEGRATVATTVRVLATALVLLTAVVLLAGLLAVRQVLARHHAARAPDRRVERVLGLTTGEQRRARVLASGVAAAVAFVVTAVGGFASGVLEPIGGIRFVEPRPGFAPHLGIVAAGSLVTAAAVVGLAATAVRARRTGDASQATYSPLVERAAQLGGSPPTVVGLRLALEPGRGDRSVPVRPALLGTVLGVAGVVSAIVFTASLDRLVETPARYGAGYDAPIFDIDDDELEDIAADDRLGAVVRTRTAPVEVEGRSIVGHALVPVRGRLPIDLVDGRLPGTPTEVVLGLRIADELGAEVGDLVAFTDVDGAERDYTVVGTGVVPTLNGEQLGRNALLTSEGLDAVAEAQPTLGVVINASDGEDADEVVADLQTRYEAIPDPMPADVDNLRQLGRLPAVIGLLVGAIAGIVLVNALVAVVRRRRRDLAMLRTFGFTSGQTSRSVVVMSLVISTVGALVGVPLGLLAGREVWRIVAEGAAVAPDPLVPAGLLALVVVVAVLLAVAAALVPARAAAAEPPIAALRTE